ncbi:MAG TPA: tail length tape measure protein [Cyanobacteria bacterium UBA8803]|nr:tail length tape measure protein [Cyanobacteria bacterium UBA9273]HBL60321.1 tail length tape measure protein [Cyanobacteria bacterium UBA8803]
MKKSRQIFSPYSLSRRKRQRTQLKMVAGIGLCALLMGGTLLATKNNSLLGQLTIRLPSFNNHSIPSAARGNTPALRLAALPAPKRTAQLEAIARGDKPLERARARYLLAADLIEQQQGQKALRWLEGLEWDYPVLAGYVALKRAQAYELTGNTNKALEAWQHLLKKYTSQPVAAQALYALSAKDSKYRETTIAASAMESGLVGKVQHFYAFSPEKPKYWEKAIAKYPSHPLILELARQKQKQEPAQPELMLLLARYAFDAPEITAVLDQLVGKYGRTNGDNDKPLIQSQDWEAIAKGYWQDRKYGQASAAYAKAERTSRHAYLSARALQLAEKELDAKRAYQKLVQDFPKAKETPDALLQLAKLEPDIEAVPYLDQVIDQYPDRAAEALLAKAETLDRLKSEQAAAKARELLLSQYSNAEAAATYRWQVAQAKAATGDLETAWQAAKAITTNNPQSLLARQAGFWAGKWANKLGHKQEAKVAFEQVIANHPQSYYAWRSAVQLGWNVGDFTTVRQLDPQLVLPPTRPVLPVGSETLKELYQLGQDQDAWMLWQAEFHNRMQPTVAEQFTDGLLRIAGGDYLKGISTIASLEDRENPQEKAEYEKLRQQPAYWHALYPLPFREAIETYSEERNLNPLLVTAIIRQESRFEPEIRSVAGAVGLMQMMPSTGAWAAKHINLKQYALENPDDNIKLGTWFLQQIHQTYKNNSLLAIASYNAGQGNTGQWLAQKGSTDPDEFVEAIPFDETKDYVKQVFGNYWNYLRLYDPQVQARLTKHVTVESTAMR